jgi:hypothetical protein
MKISEGRLMSNIRFLLFTIAFAWFIWFMLHYEPGEPEPRPLSHKYAPSQTEVMPQEEEGEPHEERLSAQEQRAMLKDRVRVLGRQ